MVGACDRAPVLQLEGSVSLCQDVYSLSQSVSTGLNGFTLQHDALKLNCVSVAWMLSCVCFGGLAQVTKLRARGCLLLVIEDAAFFHQQVGCVSVL